MTGVAGGGGWKIELRWRKELGKELPDGIFGQGGGFPFPCSDERSEQAPWGRWPFGEAFVDMVAPWRGVVTAEWKTDADGDHGISLVEFISSRLRWSPVDRQRGFCLCRPG